MRINITSAFSRSKKETAWALAKSIPLIVFGFLILGQSFADIRPFRESPCFDLSSYAGGTDASAAITNAVALAGTNGTVCARRGSSFTLGSTITLNVAGQRWLMDGVSFTAASSFTATGNAIFNITADNVVASGFEIDGNASGQAAKLAGFRIIGDRDELRDNIIHNVAHAAIFAHATTATNGDEQKIIGNRIYDVVDLANGTVGNGIFAQDQFGKTRAGIVIRDNYIDLSNQAQATTKSVAIQLWGADASHLTGGEIDGNVIRLVVQPTDNGHTGIEMRFATGGARGNDVNGGGIAISGAADSQGLVINGNTVANFQNIGIEAGANDFETISANDINGGAIGLSGVSLDGARAPTYTTVSANKIRGTKNQGVYVTSAATYYKVTANGVQMDVSAAGLPLQILTAGTGGMVGENTLIGGTATPQGILITNSSGLTVGLNSIVNTTAGVRLVATSGSTTNVRVVEQNMSGVTNDYELATSGGTLGTGIRFPAGVLKRADPATAVTGSTSRTVLDSFTLKGNRLRPGEQLRITTLYSATGSAGTKTASIRFGASTDYVATAMTTAQLSAEMQTIIRNKTASSQIAHGSNGTGYGALSGANLTSAVDTTADVTIQFACQLSVGTDSCTLESWSVEIIRDQVSELNDNQPLRAVA